MKADVPSVIVYAQLNKLTDMSDRKQFLSIECLGLNGLN